MSHAQPARHHDEPAPTRQNIYGAEIVPIPKPRTPARDSAPLCPTCAAELEPEHIGTRANAPGIPVHYCPACDLIVPHGAERSNVVTFPTDLPTLPERRDLA